MLKILKRLSVISFIFIIVFTGCSSDGDNSDSDSSKEGETIELSYWVPFSGSDGEFMEDMVSKFNESQDEIKVEFMNNNWDDYYTKLKTSLVSNSAPDVAISHVSSLGELIPTGNIEPLDELAEKADLDWSTYSENQIEAIMNDNQHYAVPLDTHALIMFYNKKYLEEADLLNDDGTLKAGENAEDFTEMLRTLKKELPNDVSPLVIGSNNVFTFWVWDALINQQGAPYMEGNNINVDSPESHEAMELLKTWLDEDLMPADVGDSSYDIFKTQGAAITFTGVWATGNFETEEDLDFAAIPFPQLYEQPATWGDSHTLIVPKQDDEAKQVAAVKFADWLANNGEMWAEAGHIPTKPEVIESEEYQEMPYRSDYAEVMDIVKYMPKTDKLSAINDSIIESLVKINYGQISVKDGLEEAQIKVEDLSNE